MKKSDRKWHKQPQAVVPSLWTLIKIHELSLYIFLSKICSAHFHMANLESSKISNL